MKLGFKVALIAVVVLQAGIAHAAFTPPADLLGWYAADSIDGQNNATVSNGAAVTTWKNLASPGTFDAVASGVNNQPTFIKYAAAINNHSVVRLDGVNDGFFVGDMDTTAGGAHIFVVSQSDETDGFNYQRLFSAYANGSANDYTGESVYLTRPFTNVGVPTAYAWNIAVNSFASGKKIENAHIGRQSKQASEWFDGLIAEVLVFNRQLTSSEVTSVQSYLNTKYSTTAIPEPAMLVMLPAMALVLRRRR